MKPLEAGFLHPVRSVVDPSRMNVERGAHSEHYLAGQKTGMLGHEVLLLRRAEPHPEIIRPRALQPIFQFRFLLAGERTKRWSVSSDHPDPRKPILQIFSQLLHDPGLPSIQKVRVTGSHGTPADFFHQVRTENAPHLRMTLMSSHPDGRHSVRDD